MEDLSLVLRWRRAMPTGRQAHLTSLFLLGYNIVSTQSRRVLNGNL